MYNPPLVLAPLLYIPEMIYRAGVYLRNRAFDAGFMPSRSLTWPVVSVGNLTLGGTGKTPFVIYLAGLLKEIGCETAVLTRGYGRRDSGKTIILPPGESTDFSVSRLGDEPALIRRRLPKAWLGISPDRFSAACAIARHDACEERLVFILDDGFQHRGIRRDLDVVIIDPSRLPGDERLFPAGGLREPASELRRARVIIINGAGVSAAGKTRSPHFETIKEGLRKYAPEAEFFHCVQPIKAIIPYSAWFDFQTSNNSAARPDSAFLATAIGNPDRFKNDVQSMGIEIRGCAFYRDHTVIGKKNWEKCAVAAKEAKADAIIITEKDAVKIYSPPDFPLLVAVQSTVLTEAARFREILQNTVAPMNRPYNSAVPHIR